MSWTNPSCPTASTAGRPLAAVLALLVLAAAAGCSSNTPPVLLPIAPATGYVGSRLEIPLEGSDADGDALTYDFQLPTLDISSRARVYHLGGGAVFVWTPAASDVGTHQVDFTVSDGDELDRQPVQVTIRPSGSGDTAPVFRKPLGEGTTLDLGTTPCLKLDVVVEDPDSTQVSIAQSPPIAGSKLDRSGALRALFSWCPTSAQAATAMHVLRLVADDRDNPPVVKRYTILLRSDLPQNCPGAAPVIVHTPPGPQTSAKPVALEATVTDDKGLKQNPTLYYTTSKPPDPSRLEFGKLSQLSMSKGGSATYSASVPNPTKGLDPGDKRTLYYVIVAEDDDDGSGPCDHRTRLPTNKMFSVTITRPQGRSPCTSSAQCTTGQVCDGTSCVSDSCSPKDTNGDKFLWEQGSCPAKHFCPVSGVAGPSHCAQACVKDTDCAAKGAVCKVFDTKSGCGQPGTRVVGRECTDFTQCQGKLMCLPWPGGYCALSDCDSGGSFSGPCPTGSACIPLPDPRFTVLGKHWLCLQLCKGNSNCRTADGYTCKTIKDDKGQSRKVCLK